MGSLNRRRTASLAGALFMVAVAMLGRAEGAATAGSPLPLLVPVPARAVAPAPDTVVLRREPVAVVRRALPDGPTASAIPLAMFGVSHTAMLGRADTTTGSDATWTGTLDGAEDSEVVLAERNGAFAGTIRLGDALYRISPSQDGTNWLEAVDRSAFLPDGDPEPGDAPADDAEADTATAADAGSIIDVMVVYTAAARTGAGSASGMSALIAVAITETNSAYQRSLVSQRIRLVYSGEVTYTESGSSSTDLTRLRATTDGFMDEVHALRDQYGADLVVLLTETLDECGRAYSMTRPGSSFATSAFSVVKRTCANGQYSFGHELGHNMGAGHDRVTGCTSAYTYACGYQEPNYRFRTMMAYDCPVSCTRVPYFSNPNVTYLGLPTGIAEDSPTAAYNAKALNNTAATVAAFRPSVNGVALAIGPTPGTTSTGGAFNVTVTVQNSAGATVVTDQSTVVTLAVATGNGAVTCDGPLTRSAVNGVAAYTNCRLSGTGIFQLTATASNLPLTPATSAAISVSGYRLPIPMVAADPGSG